MKLYRVHLLDLDGSQGYEFFTNRRDAKRCMKEFIEDHEELPEWGKQSNDPEIRHRRPEPELEEIEIEVSKKGILNFIHWYARHANNG